MSEGLRTVYVPSGIGRVAMSELDRVHWEDLAHAGTVGSSVPDALAALAATEPAANERGIDQLFTLICHQGTIYEASAHAVPFLLALLGQRDLPVWLVEGVAALLGSIGLASTVVTESGTGAGAYGAGVAERVRAAFRCCKPQLSALATTDRALSALLESLLSVVVQDEATPEKVRRLERCIRDLGEKPRALPPNYWKPHLDRIKKDSLAEPLPKPEADPLSVVKDDKPRLRQAVRHPQFGEGTIVSRNGNKVRVCFANGRERTLLESFLDKL